MKKNITIVLYLLLALSLAGCGKNDVKTSEIVGAENLTVSSGTSSESIEFSNADEIKNDTKTFEIVGAEKLAVTSGTTGERIEIANTDDIKYISDNISALKYSNGGKVNSTGWHYALQWFDKDGKTLESLTLLGDGYTVIYDGYYYKGMSADNEIDLAFLASQFAK